MIGVMLMTCPLFAHDKRNAKFTEKPSNNPARRRIKHENEDGQCSGIWATVKEFEQSDTTIGSRISTVTLYDMGGMKAIDSRISNTVMWCSNCVTLKLRI